MILPRQLDCLDIDLAESGPLRFTEEAPPEQQVEYSAPLSSEAWEQLTGESQACGGCQESISAVEDQCPVCGADQEPSH